tara:strand:- start:7170 stop:7556 length:387 start_codon:yes stop_codon:yes gene_type:complete
MDYNEIIKDYSEAKKDMIVNLIELNKITVQDSDKYHTGALNTFFDLWKEHFPKQRQSKGCLSCRKAVFLFFSNVADFISKEKMKASETAEVVEPVKEVKKKPNKIKRAKVVKKHKTVTGALSPTGARN